MARGATFDDLFATTGPAHYAEVAGDEPPRRWFASWEEWLTLMLVLLLQVPIIGSLESANWVDEMPSLAAAAGIGVAAGWLLAQSRLRATLATAGGVVVGFVAVIGLVLTTMERVDLELGEGTRGALHEFALRLKDWGAALINSGISADPMPFILLMVGIVVLVAYLSSWSVVRWRNPWMALVPGGVVLLTNISYLPGQPSLAFIIYVFAAVLLVTRMYFLRSHARWERLRVNSPEGMSLEVLGAGTMIALVIIAFAWVVPTANNWGPVTSAWDRVTAPVQDRVDSLSHLFIGIRSKRPLPVHAYGATLPIQGRLRLDAVPMYEVYAEEPGLLRGAAYDEYTGAGWRQSDGAREPATTLTVAEAQFGTPETVAFLRLPVLTEVLVLDESAPDAALLVPGEAMATDADADLLLGPAREPLGIAPHDPAREGTRYTTVGSVSVAAISTLQAAGTDYPSAIYGPYTALPDDVPVEVHELAQSIVADAATPYEAAVRIEAYLREQYEFTLRASLPPPRSDAVAHFLFESQQGHFDHFASAMAVMLRSVGIPARVAVGFVLEPRDQDPDTKAFNVSERSAWAWPEVYFPDLGWVEFNPTPARPTMSRPGDDTQALLERDAVLGGGAFDGDEFLDDFFLELLALEYLEAAAGFGGEPLDLVFEDEASGGVLSTLLTWLMIGAAVGLAALLAGRFWWERGFRSLAPSMRRWAKVQRLAHWAGVGAAYHRTPVEAAHDLAPVVGEPRALTALAQTYTRGRYGPTGSADESEAERRERDDQYRRVRVTLWRLVARRLLPFGRRSAQTSPALPGRHAVGRHFRG